MDAPLPSSVISERTVVVTALIDSAVVPEFVRRLGASDFTLPVARAVFGAIRELWDQRRPVDIESVLGRVDPGVASEVEDLPRQWAGCGPSSFELHCNTLREFTARRRVMVEAIRLGEAASNPETPVLDLVRSASDITDAARSGDAGVLSDASRDGLSLIPTEVQTMPWLIDKVIPAGVVGLLYAAGGAGKSTLALDLSVRVALGAARNIDHLGSAVTGGGSVYYLTAEDPPLIIGNRLAPILDVIAEDLGSERYFLREELDRKFYIRSTVGEVAPFITGDSRSGVMTSQHFDGFLRRLGKISDLKLVVVDTLTRYCPFEDGDGGNAMATALITLLERIPKETGATVLALHHTNKATRGTDASGAQAFRGVSAIFDCSRFCWYLRKTTNEESSALDSKDSYVLECSKNNYGPIPDPIVFERQGYRFRPSGKSLAVEKGKTKIEREREQVQKAMEGVEPMTYNETVAWLMKTFGKSQATSKRWISELYTLGIITKVGDKVSVPLNF